jgi:hypothetical protein
MTNRSSDRLDVQRQLALALYAPLLPREGNLRCVTLWAVYLLLLTARLTVNVEESGLAAL